MSFFKRLSVGGLLALVVLMFEQARAQTTVPVYVDPQANTYADWRWQCSYYIDYVYIDDFPNGWRPPWYHGTDWYWGQSWSGYVPSGYWQPYIYSACYWVLSAIYDIALVQVPDTQEGCTYKITVTMNNNATKTFVKQGNGGNIDNWIIQEYYGTSSVVSASAQRVCVTIVSQTVATTPANRARKKLGVGESTTLSLSPQQQSVSWSLSGPGSLSSSTGSTTTFRAGERASSTTVTASFNGFQVPLTYSIVEPAAVLIEQEPGTGTYHIKGTPSVGFLGRPYIGPDDVSFENILVREGAASGIGNGYYGYMNGWLHQPGNFQAVSYVVPGKGSIVHGVDTIQAGTDGHLPYSSGIFVWPVPWLFKVGASGVEKVFATVNHVQVIDSQGTLTVSKGGTSKSAALNDPTSSY